MTNPRWLRRCLLMLPALCRSGLLIPPHAVCMVSEDSSRKEASDRLWLASGPGMTLSTPLKRLAAS